MEPPRPQPEQPIPDDATKVFEGVIFSVHQWQQRLYNGQEVTFEALSRPDSVNILPITDDGKIILTLQEQPGMQPFIGALGGRVDPGETALQAAERELFEEAGLRTSHLELWDAMQPMEKMDWTIWTYIAKGCQKAGEQEVDGGEKISLIEVTFDEYLQIILQDNYRDTEIAFKLLRLSALGRLDEVEQAWFN